MSAREVVAWSEFEADFGPITLHERIDAAVQRIAYTIHASAGGKEPPDTFAMRWQRPIKWTDAQLWSWMEAESRRN